MASTSFTISGDVDVLVTVTEVDGNLKFDLKVLNSTGSIGDLRGFFFNIDDSQALAGLTITGDDVTRTGTNTKDLGQGNNLNGASGSPFDVGISFGTPGIGSDDIRETSFTLSTTADLSLSDLFGQEFGARLTSVGSEGGARNGSSKQTTTFECKEEEVCQDITIGFNDFTAGDSVDQLIYGNLTVTVNAQVAGEGNNDNDAMIFDSANPTGGDPDLATATQGNILIITEDDDSSDPDDAADGGTIVFNFSSAVDLTSIVVVDTNAGSRIISDQGDEIIIPDLEDGQQATIDLSAFDDVTTLTIEFTGSGAVDDLAFQYCQTVHTCDCIV